MFFLFFVPLALWSGGIVRKSPGPVNCSEFRVRVSAWVRWAVRKTCDLVSILSHFLRGLYVGKSPVCTIRQSLRRPQNIDARREMAEGRLNQRGIQRLGQQNAFGRLD